MSTEHPLHELAMQIRYDLTAAQGKLTEMCRAIGELDFDDTPRESFMNGPVLADSCDSCGIGGGKHTHDCQKIHLEIATRTGTTRATARLEVARAHIPSQEQA